MSLSPDGKWLNWTDYEPSARPLQRKVIVAALDGSHRQEWVVGEFEADPLQKKLSITSPIGKALLGKKKGELIEVEVPAGKLSYRQKKF